ncbi:MAG: SpoIIE family protein phosphatase [Candidatus Riflebacteria bacterium]|nr:SpoIIE family protein phosphatase [Candidatus Riflebacteria bacterium]
MDNILIVDDQEVNRDLLTRRLSKKGFFCLTASGGIEALETLANQKIDLIILDVMMPEMDGLQVLQIVREKKSANVLPIIMATAKDQSSDIIQALSYGANDYITKPIDFDVLLARIKTQLILKNATEELARRDEENKIELKFAKTVHRSLLPCDVPKMANVDLGINFSPCNSIGGDFYDFYHYPESEKVGLFFADISGHGVAGALLMSMLKILAADCFREIGNLSQSMLNMNDRVKESFPDGKFVSALFGIIDPKKREFSFVNAAPEAIAVFKQNGEFYKPIEWGQPLGFFESKALAKDSFKEMKVEIIAGETLILFTDGITELQNPEGKMLKFSGFHQFVKEELKQPLQNTLDKVFFRASEYAGKAGPKDDIMMIGIRAK